MRRLAFLALALVLAVQDLPAGAADFDKFQIFDSRLCEPGAVDLNSRLR